MCVITYMATCEHEIVVHLYANGMRIITIHGHITGAYMDISVEQMHENPNLCKRDTPYRSLIVLIKENVTTRISGLVVLKSLNSGSGNRFMLDFLLLPPSLFSNPF